MSKDTEKEQKEGELLSDRQDLSGFFELLLKVDKRVNPHLYKKSEAVGLEND
jgi:hypothetical protein